MRLIRAQFKNFRLLRDLELEFCTDRERPLTVIRAENESGKTTILNGIQWALYGDDALPGKGVGHRLHPIDWDATTEQHVPITVQVDFEVDDYYSGLVQYRIVRSAHEIVSGDTWKRGRSEAQLFEVTDQGADPIDHPEVLIKNVLPPELREVFFTDGDRALSFVEADATTKRDRVRNAIRSLLGLAVIETGIKHANATKSAVNGEKRQFAGNAHLAKISNELVELSKTVEEQETREREAAEKFEHFDRKYKEITQKLYTVLQKGDKEELRAQLVECEVGLQQIDQRIKDANVRHTELLCSDVLARDLLSAVLTKALHKLDAMHDQGKIPNPTIPVLEDRLSANVCICGESLNESDPSGQQRREHIYRLIDESQRADEIQGIVTDLYYRTRPRQVDVHPQWVVGYRKITQQRLALRQSRDKMASKLRELESKIDALDDVDIQGLRETQKDYDKKRQHYSNERTRYQTELKSYRREQTKKEAEQRQLLRRQRKHGHLISKLEVIADVLQVLNRAYDRMTNEELDKVSGTMNGLFLEMIGTDAEQRERAIIQRAEVTHEFDIKVYGTQGRELDPDRDLNGASRRALTLAFILALTKVSEVEAPNVIDTPLGMMSGYVKRSVLRTSIRESSQLILFLTRSEISGCEDILDEAAGIIVTLTNPAHYPVMLANDPGIREQRVLRCDCDHRSQCVICERREDARKASHGVEPAI